MVTMSAERRRRRLAGALVVLLAAVMGISSRPHGKLVFVGQLPRELSRGQVSTTLYATQPASKQKQKLSLSEALERQKAKQQEQDEKKEEAKLAPEQTFWEGPPSSTELFAPFLSCFLVIGVIPFLAAVNRQFRVKYKITDRRVSVASGWDGKDVTEFSYQEIYEMKYGLRWLGYCADMRINLRDGAKVELFGLLNFEQNYQYIYERCDKDARKRSDKPPQERF